MFMLLFGAFRMCFLASYSACTQPFRLIALLSFTDSGNYLTGKYGLSFVMTIILFVAALIVTIIGIALRIWKRHTIDMLYGALGILDVACWLISVSQITPFLQGYITLTA